ncbi:MAG: hypothetical protein RBR77_07060 [Thauera sp.]|jgi:hypothetical protein|nr:hypothetical protein [Thauera sp.]
MSRIISTNPLVMKDRDDTLRQVNRCLCFLSRACDDITELGDWAEFDGPVVLSVEELRGLKLLLDCVKSAVAAEVMRAEP